MVGLVTIKGNLQEYMITNSWCTMLTYTSKFGGLSFFYFFLNERDRSTGWSNSQNPHLLLVGFYYDWYIQDWMGHRNCYMHVPLISFDCAITIFIWSHQSIFWSLSWDWLCNYTRYEWKYMDFFFFLPILAKNHWFSRKTFAFKIDNELWSLIIANVQSQNKDWSSR